MPAAEQLADTASVGPEGYRIKAAVGPSGRRSPLARTTVTLQRPSAPPAPTGLSAKPGPGKVALAWKSPDRPLLRFNIYRAEGVSNGFRLVAGRWPRANAFLDMGLTPGAAHCYRVNRFST